MTRTFTATLLTAFLCGLFAAPAVLAGASADEWSDIKRDALKQYLASADESRMEALMKIGRADCRGAVELLVKLLKARTPEEDGLMARAKANEDKIASIYARNKALLKKSLIATVDQIEIQKLTLELQEISKKINFISRVKQKTSDALALCKSELSFIIEKVLTDRDWQVRFEAVQALAAMGGDEALAAVRGALKDDDYKVRTEILEIAMNQGWPDMDDAFIEALADDWWQVRSIAVKAIRGKKLYRAVGALIEALQVEDGRLTLEMDDALYDLTGKRYYGDRELWARWWAANKAKFESEVQAGQVPETVREKQDAGGHGGGVATTSFYGIKTASKRIIFVLDISGSMQEKADLKDGPGSDGPKVTGEGAPAPGQDPAERFKPKEDTKIEVAKCELKRAICNLPEDAVFNIVFYNFEIEVYQKGVITATKANKERAYGYIDGKQPVGATNIHDALQDAFEISMPEKNGKGRSGRAQVTGSSREEKPTRGGVDTIFFLTDGKPTSGRILEPAAILAAVKLWNLNRKIQIHTIGVGDHDKDFLQKLATQNEGTYVKR